MKDVEVLHEFYRIQAWLMYKLVVYEINGDTEMERMYKKQLKRINRKIDNVLNSMY